MTMKNIDKELVDWAVHKIETEYAQDVDLLIGQVGGGKIPTDEQNMVFDFFIPATERGYQLAQTFIIEDMGYDLYPISWERLKGIVEIEEPRMIFALGKGEVIYARTVKAKERFEKLKAEMLARLQDKAIHFPKSLEFLATAQDIFRNMLFEDSLCKIRKAAGGVCSYLMNSIAMVNGTYLESGYMNLTNDLHGMKDVPERFEEVFEEMLSANEVGEIRGKAYELINMTRQFLMDRRPVKEVEQTEPNYDDLAMWYQEARYTFRRIQYFTSIGSAEDSYLLGCYLQIEFDAIQGDFALEEMDLMSSYREGEAIYIPKQEEKKRWGEGSGARAFYKERNEKIQADYGQGITIEALADKYGLSLDSIKRIVYNRGRT